jgi:hypothetical protein
MRNNVFDHWISIVIRVGGKLQVGCNYDLSTLNWSQLSIHQLLVGFFLPYLTHMLLMWSAKKDVLIVLLDFEST